MPKKKATPHQQILFRREIPQMPEGYYSSGPNPNLRRFVEEHATPYDPDTDDYHVPPFDKPITTTKATAIYNMHTYWSKKPHDAIREYIKHYTKPDDLVLDPFCGSGGTALAALMEGRAAIAIDLSPAATFIAKNYCTPVDVDELQQAFETLQRQVKPEMDWLYETRCDRCDGRATTAYTVYSYVFQCPRCLERVALFDCPEADSQTAKGKLKKIRVCPVCLGHGHQEEIKTSGVRFDPVPVMVSYLCEEGCKPQRGERRHNDPDEKKRTYFEKYDLGKIEEIEGKEIPYWYPPHRMMNVESDTEPWGDEWRPGRNFRTVADLFTKRNLWALALIKAEAQKSNLENFFGFTLTGASLHCSRMAAHKETGGGYMMGTYYIPQIFKERMVWNTFVRKYDENFNGVSQITHFGLMNISTQSATDMDSILPNSIDYIFTDPPYAGNIQYGELNFVWEALMNFKTDWHDLEIIVNNIRGKTDSDWSRMMDLSMCECFRVLKPGRWISLCYHDTSEGTWHIVQDLMTEIGFIPEKSETTLFIDAGQKSYNQLTAEKVTKRDLVINFRKPYPGEISGQPGLFAASDFSTFQEAACAVLVEALTAHPGNTADRLYDELVSRLVRKGQFERHDFDALLRSVAEPVHDLIPGVAEMGAGGRRWYLRASADVVDKAESAKEDAAAVRLEKFMKNYSLENPEENGVHYSDLFEQYLPIVDKPRRLLQDWLPEFFYKTADGTWRPPANEEERQQKAGLRSSGALRRIKRFANALLDGTPPADRDKPENAVTLADWMRQCRRAGLFELGRVLYERSGLNFEELSEEMRLQVDEDYQICVGRGEKKIQAKKIILRKIKWLED